jgi:hypothetical protein
MPVAIPGCGAPRLHPHAPRARADARAQARHPSLPRSRASSASAARSQTTSPRRRARPCSCGRRGPAQDARRRHRGQVRAPAFVLVGSTPLARAQEQPPRVAPHRAPRPRGHTTPPRARACAALAAVRAARGGAPRVRVPRREPPDAARGRARGRAVAVPEERGGACARGGGCDRGESRWSWRTGRRRRSRARWTPS